MATTTTKISIPSAVCAAINAAKRALSYDLHVTRDGLEVLAIDIIIAPPATFNEEISRDCFLTLQVFSGETYFAVDVWVLLKKQSKWSPVMGGRWIPKHLHLFSPGGKNKDSGRSFRFHMMPPCGIVILPDNSEEARAAWIEALNRR